jgi:23S rRNA pseudouridine2605 synthase
LNIEQTSYSSFSKEFVLLAVNKPRGIICTHNDEKNRKRIYDLIPKTFIRNIKGNLHSIGRLDFNSQGLILLTNNTKIKAYLEKPSSKIIRTYKVKVQGLLTDSIIKKTKKGMYINNIFYSVKKIEIFKKTKSYSWLLVKLDEGKNNHIRKVFKKLGFSVNKLVRIQYGPYRIGSLKTGEVKFLNINKVKFNYL